MEMSEYISSFNDSPDVRVHLNGDVGVHLIFDDSPDVGVHFNGYVGVYLNVDVGVYLKL